MMATDHPDIDDLPISTMARNALRRAGINTVAELLAQPDKDLLLLRHFGAGSLRDLKRALAWCRIAVDAPLRPP